MQKVLTVRLLVKDDGSVALDRVNNKIDRLEKESNQAAGATRRLSNEQSRQASTALSAAASTGRLAAMLGGIIGAGTLGLLARESFQYNQQLESTKIGIAGLLSANREYLGTQDQWGAALAESSDLLKQIQIEALKTKATVPQLGDAFATTFGAVTAAGLKATNAEILTMTTRLTQVGNAFGVIPEQMRQEINSLVSGMITEDSLIARRLGFDNKSIKEMQRNGTFVAELIRRTEAYAKAAEAQANTLSGKILNTREIIVATFSRGLDGAFKSMQGLLDKTFGWFVTNGPAVEAAIQRAARAIEAVVGTTVAWARENKELIGSVLAVAGAVGLVAGAIKLVEGALLLASAPAMKFTVALLAIVAVWEGVRKLAPIEIGGHTVAGYVSWFATTLGGSLWHAGVWAKNIVVVVLDAIKSLFAGVLEWVSRKVEAFGDFIGSDTIKGWGANAKEFWTGVLESAAPDHNAMRARLDEIRGWVHDAQEAALGATQLPSMAEMGSEGLTAMLGSIKQMFPEVEKVGADLHKKLFGSVARPGSGNAAGESQYNESKFRGSIDKLFNGEAFAGDLARRGFSDGVVSKFVEAAIDMQQRAEDGRLGVIEDSVDREYRTRLAQIAREYEAQVKAAGANRQLLDQAEAHRKEKEGQAAADRDRNREEQRRLQREQLAGTKEWAEKMAREIGTVPDQVTRMIGESKMVLSGFFGDLFNDVVDGVADLGKSFDNLWKGMAKSFGRMMSDMLTKAIVGKDSIVSQLKQVWSSLGQGGPADVAIQGAGVGGFVGSMFQTEQNYAGAGGAIGGGIGAAIGAYFGGAAGAKIGMMIGTALGTAIGAMITKGKDQIRVAIVDGVATLTETGISAEARMEVQTQIQRQVKEQMKGWQSIIDLFPQAVRDHLAKLKWKATLNLSGGVENADITDEGALNALSDFLGNDLPKAAFGAYRSGIEIALQQMGVQKAKLDQILTYWGTLQGKELQDSVRGYVTALVDAVAMRDLMARPATPGVIDGAASTSAMVGDARRLAGQTSLDRLGEIQSQIATIVASASKLTDIEDVVAAQQQVNQLARQYYDMGIARLQRIDAIEKSILGANEQLAEQIKLAGMDDQGKIDYYYDRMGDLRGQLELATNEDDIQRITQQIQQYVSSALGLAPENQENRDKLLAILDDIGVISSDKLQDEREKQEAKDKQQLTLLQQQLEALIGIKAALGGETGDDKKKKDSGEDTGEDGERRRFPINRLSADGGEAQIGSFIERLNQLTRVEQAGRELRDASGESAKQMAAAIESALSKLTLTYAGQEQPPDIVLDLGEYGQHVVQQSVREMRFLLKNNPDFGSSRTRG